MIQWDILEQESVFHLSEIPFTGPTCAGTSKWLTFRPAQIANAINQKPQDLSARYILCQFQTPDVTPSL